MASSQRPLEVELVIERGKDLKNVNWRNGNLRVYAVAWVDPERKVSTNVDASGDTDPVWNETLRLPLPYGVPPQDLDLRIDVVHENPAENTKPLVGTVRLPLAEILEDASGFGNHVQKKLKLKRPSGRPHGKLDVAVAVREIYPAPYPAPGAATYGYADRSYGYGSYGQQQQPGYYVNPGYGNPAASYGYANPSPAYGQGYANAPSGYPYQSENPGAKKGSSSKYGLGTGLAVGAVAGVLGGLAIGEAVDYAEDKFDEKVDERVQENLEEQQDFGGDDFGGGDDW